MLGSGPGLGGVASELPARQDGLPSGLLVQLFKGLQAEGFPMPYTMEDFRRDFVKEHFSELTPEEQEHVFKSLPPGKREDVIKSLTPEERLAGLSAEQIRRYLDQLSAERPAPPRKRRRKI
jgi:hypothetical protein